MGVSRLSSFYCPIDACAHGGYLKISSYTVYDKHMHNQIQGLVPRPLPTLEKGPSIILPFHKFVDSV